MEKSAAVMRSRVQADIEVDTRGLSGEEQMFRYSRGQTQVGVATIVVINGLCNNDNHHCLKRNITFTTP
ncbi:hypothetical protein J1N35_044562 [Gossypium stocksii]|uniref:Uncharacterized protein n=1 Tax=Gossypium stocksii TaxID=47602 RepID=A0A9D3U9R0_9ROSI|nr:hypothetical protein J1N35_044562 [Gossypium stocksii]